MAAVWSIINNALAMLKEPRPEMRMINVGLMGFLVDWDNTVRPQWGPEEILWPVIVVFGRERGNIQKHNMAVVVKKTDSVFVSEGKRQTRVMNGSCLSESWRVWKGVGRESSFFPVMSWEIHLFNMNQCCQRILIKNRETSAFCSSVNTATQFLLVGKCSFQL